MYDLLTLIVCDVHIKSPRRSTTLSVTATRVLLGKEDLLTHGVQYFVFILCLKSCTK